MKIVTADITGSLIVNGTNVTDNVVSSSVFSGSIAGRVTNLEQFSASLDATFATDASVTASILVLSQSVQASQAALSSSYTATSASYLATSASYVIVSGSYAAASASLSIRTTDLEATASINTQASASFAAYSASVSTRLTTDETNITTLTNASASFAAQSASLSTRLTTDETNYTNLSSSFATTSGSIAGRVTLIEGQYATTGSNTFTKPQQITDISNATGFTTTASLYTDGGLRVKGAAYISGTAYFNDVVVYGTSSIEYITSSQLAIGTNIITLNTDTPSIRYGGISVYDSGSNNLSTGSLFWDSEKDKWIYSNPSSSTYDGGMLISGPRNTSGLGNEVGTTSCALMMGQGGDHITSSAIFSYGNATCFYGNSYISGSGLACFAGAVCSSNLYASSDSRICGNLEVAAGSSTSIALYNAGSIRACISMTGNEGDLSLYSSAAAKNVYLSAYYDSYINGPGKFGIGTSLPCSLLHIGTYASAGKYVDSATLPTAPSNYLITLSPPSTTNYYGGGIAWSEGACVAAGINAYDDGALGALGLSISTGTNSELSERIRITSAGIACFACQVCTNGTMIRGGNDLRLYRSQNDYYWRINPDSSNFLQIGPYCSNGTPYSSCNTLTFRDDGKFGIGTQNPVNVLDVYKCNNTNVNMSITNLYVNQGNLIQFCQNTSGGSVLAYMGHAGDSTGDFVLFNGSTGTPRHSVSCLGITSFACQVCAPQYITTQGSSVSYAAGTDYIVWNSEAESCIQDNNNPAAYTRIKTWIADRSGCVTMRFTGYIASGPTYWGYRVTRNGTSSYMCVSYAQCGQPGCASPYVHGYSSYQFNVGPFLPGDCIGLDVVSTGGGATPAPGQGQYIYAKEFRVFSTTPNFSAGTAGNVFGEWVGVGTCTPFSNLYINGNNSAAYDASVDNGQDGCGVTLTIRNNSTTTNSFAQLNMQVSGDSGRAVGRIALIRTASATGDIAFVNESGNTKNEVMRLISDGKVAIGTTNANGYVLRVSSNSNNNPSCAAKIMVLGNDVVNAISGFMYIGSYAGIDWLVGKDTCGAGDYRFNLSLYTGEPRMTLYTNGNYSFAGSNVSDFRLKSNINSLCIDATDKISRLTPKCYNMDGVMRYGFVAQDVKPVLSDLITGEEKEKEYLGLDYNGILTVAVKAIQEQQCRIKLLESCLGIM